MFSRLIRHLLPGFCSEGDRVTATGPCLLINENPTSCVLLWLLMSSFVVVAVVGKKVFLVLTDRS